MSMEQDDHTKKSIPFMESRSFSAIILAGGRGKRLGNIDKPTMYIGKYRLLERAIHAVSSAQSIIIVGKHRDELDSSIFQVQESPPHSGPVAALYAGVYALMVAKKNCEFIITLASDLPGINSTIIAQLIDALAQNTSCSAFFALDSSHRIQYSIAAWRYEALVQSLGYNNSTKQSLEHNRVVVPEKLINLPWKNLLPSHFGTLALDNIEDCDDWNDIRKAQEKYTSDKHTRVLSIEQAWEVLAQLNPCSSVSLDLLDTPDHIPLRGMTLAENLIAKEPHPVFRISGMDGYAVHGKPPWKIKSGSISAGENVNHSLMMGEGISIATGAKVPDTADRVLRHEFCQSENGYISTEILDRDDCRAVGEDWESGKILAAQGTAVDLPLRSLCASLGQTLLKVRGPLSAHIYLTGDEIIPAIPTERLISYTPFTRDALGPIFPELLTATGIIVKKIDYISDHLNEIRFSDHKTQSSIDSAASINADIIIIVGGTGGSPFDRFKQTIEKHQGRFLFEGISCSPGGSSSVVELTNGQIIVGLPGNPLAAFTSYHLLLPHLVQARTGRIIPQYSVAPVIFHGQQYNNRSRILPVFLDPQGQYYCPSTIRTSHLGDLVGAWGLALIPPVDSENNAESDPRIGPSIYAKIIPFIR